MRETHPRLSQSTHLVALWAQRVGVASVQGHALYLDDGELFLDDTLRELQIKQRETLHIVKRSGMTNRVGLSLISLFHSLESDPSCSVILNSEPPAPNRTVAHQSVIPSTGYPPSQLPAPQAQPQPQPVSSAKPKIAFAKFFFSPLETIKPANVLLQPLKQFEGSAAQRIQAVQEAARKQLEANDEFHRMRPAVTTPAGTSENTWLLYYLVALYNNADVIYSHFAPLCTTETCPHTSAGVFVSTTVKLEWIFIA